MRRTGLSSSVPVSLISLLALLGTVAFSNDLTVYQREVGSYSRTEQTHYLPGNKNVDGLHSRDITQSLILVVKLVPAQTAVDVNSLEPFSKTAIKAARSSIDECLGIKAVQEPLTSIVAGFRNRLDVPEAINHQFHAALFKCLEPARHEQFNYATEFHTKKIIGEWKSEQPHPLYPRINGLQ